MSETIFEFLPKGKGKIHLCLICGQEFRGRKRAKLCGKPACIAEQHRRNGVKQWRRTHGSNFNRRAPGERFKKCPCGTVIENTCGNKKYCDTCRVKTQGERRLAKAARRKANGAVVDPQGSVQCPACGWRLQFGYDFLGRSMEHCGCGERRVQLYGQRTYDQRTRLEAELRARQDTVEAPVQEKFRNASAGRTQHCKDLKWGKALGDAFRQQTHKKGRAEFLNEDVA